MSSPGLPRITPWVGRLMAVCAVVQLVLATVLTSPKVLEFLAFDPDRALHLPWTFVSYMFVHASLLHLATNMLALYVFGTQVENRMGPRAFILYYLYCGVGAAVFALTLNLLTPLALFVGASGAIMGVAMAFAMYWPDAEILVFPIPVPIRARTLVFGLAALDILMARLFHDGSVAHEAHLGGLLFGYLFFKVQALSARRPAAQPRQPERVLMAQSAVREADPRGSSPVRSIPRPNSDPVTAEVDRVLDKISAKGIGSLTPEERRFLDEVSKRKQRDGN